MIGSRLPWKSTAMSSKAERFSSFVSTVFASLDEPLALCVQ